LPVPELAGLIVDYGGVLTNALHDTMTAWAEADSVDVSQFGAAMQGWFESHYAATDGEAGSDDAATANPVHLLERGEISVPDFERALASRMQTRDGSPIVAEGLLSRMFAGFRIEPTMHDVLRNMRAAGIKTALLSNSWGNDYPREGWEELFDVVVISGEVGMRKPEPGIFVHTAEALGLPPERCVMVDDLRPNVRGAVAVGMVGVHHTDPELTIAELEALFGVPLR
jgi:epoxide hydrolase-like predicted phosphatase